MKSISKLMAASCIVIAAGFPGIAYADIVGVSTLPGSTGTLTVISPPSTVGDNFNINENLGPVVAFDEMQNVVLSSPLAVDLGSTIAAGTVVDSQFFSANQLTAGDGTYTLTLDGPVLGIVYLDGSANYAETDFLGAPGTTYTESTCPQCGFEPGDLASFTGDTATFTPSFDQPGDMARIISLAPTTTSTVPEPAAYQLLLTGLALISIPVARRRKSPVGPRP